MCTEIVFTIKTQCTIMMTRCVELLRSGWYTGENPINIYGTYTISTPITHISRNSHSGKTLLVTRWGRASHTESIFIQISVHVTDAKSFPFVLVGPEFLHSDWLTGGVHETMHPLKGLPKLDQIFSFTYSACSTTYLKPRCGIHYTSWPKGVVHGLMYHTCEPIRMQGFEVNKYKGE